MDSAVWAVVVARVGHSAKSRLGGALDPTQRSRLALAMLADVLDVCRNSDLAGTVAVVDMPAARALVEERGAHSILDPGTGDMNDAARAGIQAARERGASTVLVVPGDVPLLAAHDLDALLQTAGSAPRAVIVGASRDGQGTNALLLRPPDVIAPAFGPPSVGRHVSAGLAADALSAVRSGLGLALDVDTPTDLAALAAANPGRHTAAALFELGLHAFALACP